MVSKEREMDCWESISLLSCLGSPSQSLPLQAKRFNVNLLVLLARSWSLHRCNS